MINQNDNHDLGYFFIITCYISYKNTKNFQYTKACLDVGPRLVVVAVDEVHGRVVDAQTLP
jgi:hypothetical protein